MQLVDPSDLKKRKICMYICPCEKKHIIINSIIMKQTFCKKVTGILFLLLLFSFSAFGQTLTVRGTVRDVSRSALVGVSILVDGTNSGTITDLDGRFSIQAPANGKLVFSYVGYKPQTVDVNGQATVNVVMEEDTKLIDEVIVIGYGTQRKESVTGSVASVKGEIVRDVPSANITQALQGRVAGVNMEQTNSKPGASMQIRIRGTRSLSASNDPLIVLDGIPFAGSIGDISTDDIRSIDILKDASATAIYGSRGANGVILITTNKGYKSETATVSYNTYFGFKNAIKYPMMNAAEFLALRKAAGKYSTLGVDEAEDVDTDWQDLYYRQGLVTNHDLAVTGGTQTANYKFGAGYYNDQAVMTGQDYTRYSIRGSLDQEIGKYFRFGFTTNNNYSIGMGSNLGLYTVLSTTPITNPYNADGSWKRVVKMPQDDQWVFSREIIEGLGDKWIDRANAFGSYNTMYAELKIPGVEGLKLRSNVGANLRMTNNGNYTGQGVFNVTVDAPSTASISNSMQTNWAVENILTYDRTFADKHNINVVALQSAEQTTYNRSHVSARDIPSDDFQYFNLGRADGTITVNPAEQHYNQSGLLSYMGRVMYAYDNRYMISATLRSDASSRLAPGYQWHTYPAVSAGWNIKNESFMQGVEFVDMLKVRAGFGQTSNQAVEPYATLGLLNTRPYNFGSDFATGYYVSQLPNSRLGWEFSETYNVGVDFGLLNNRISGSFELYRTNTKDILLSVGLPPTSGVGSYTANVGSTSNKGWELSLNGVIIENNNGWTWEAGVNMYSNKNELTSLSSGQDKDEANWWFVGHSLNVIYDYEKIGLWNETDADYQYLQTYEPGGNAGMIKVKYTGEFDANGKPVRAIGPADRQVIDLDPKLMGGFNTRVAYKGFDLSMVGAFRAGGKLISTLYAADGYLNMLTGRRNNVRVDYWTPENTGAKYPNPAGITSGDNPKYGNTLGLFDGSYLKIRTITLGYNFNKRMIRDFGISNLRVYGTIQNPFVLFSPYHSETGMDPETNSFGNENAAVTSTYKKRTLIIGTNTPSSRNFLVGLNLTF